MLCISLDSLQKVEASNFGARSVLLHMLAAPINPADINQIQGNGKGHIGNTFRAVVLN